MPDVDVLVVGGGIVGVSTAMQLIESHPGLTVALVEKEAELGLHQSSHNSGVLHAGVYYAPGSMKAEFCRIALKDTVQFCQENGIPLEQCGKLIVATEQSEIQRLKSLGERARENGLHVELLDGAELRRREPNIAGLQGLYVPASGIVDWRAVTLAMAKRFVEKGGQILTGWEVRQLQESPGGVRISSGTSTLTAKYLIACAGLLADRLATASGLKLDFTLVPFRGEYFRLPEAKNDIVKHLIYPVPDPKMPFLGVHLTRMIGGYVTVGPNAVLATAREGYRATDISIRDMLGVARSTGFWKMLKKHRVAAMNEIRSSFSRKRYLALCQRYCPQLTLDDLLPHRSGVRAQAVLDDGTLAQDFLIRRTTRTIHVCNAPSPAATCSLPIGAYLSREAAAHFDLGTGNKPALL